MPCIHACVAWTLGDCLINSIFLAESMHDPLLPLPYFLPSTLGDLSLPCCLHNWARGFFGAGIAGHYGPRSFPATQGLDRRPSDADSCRYLAPPTFCSGSVYPANPESSLVDTWLRQQFCSGSVYVFLSVASHSAGRHSPYRKLLCVVVLNVLGPRQQYCRLLFDNLN